MPIVTIVATDPVAIEGTNCWVWPGTTNSTGTWTNWPGGNKVGITNCGPKNATFSVYRTGDTNSDLTVTYSIGGTASNGVDYVALPGSVTIPAGQRQAMISVVPLDDGPPERNSTVVLRLIHTRPRELFTSSDRRQTPPPSSSTASCPARRPGRCPTERSISMQPDPMAPGSMWSIPRTC